METPGNKKESFSAKLGTRVLESEVNKNKLTALKESINLFSRILGVDEDLDDDLVPDLSELERKFEEIVRLTEMAQHELATPTKGYVKDELPARIAEFAELEKEFKEKYPEEYQVIEDKIINMSSRKN